MSILLTSSGMGRDAETFHTNITTTVDMELIHHDESLDWHTDTEIQIIADFLDTRKGQRVVGDLADQIFNIYSSYFDPSGDIVIVSHSAGSRLVEEALSIIFETKSNIPVKHVMIAPAIGGSDWAKIGDLASSLITAVLTGVMALEDEDTSIENFILNLVETSTIEDIVGDETVIRKLSQGLQDIDLEITPIERHIIYGRQDELIDQIDPDLPGKTVLYKGDYTHHEVGDLSPSGMQQVYERSNGLATQLKNILFGQNITKEEVINSNLTTLL